MTDTAISITNISKAYTIRHEQQASSGNATARDALSSVIKKPLELLTGKKLDSEKFWALKDINFEINKGEVVGIIGKNGSGKSTLLKILSRIVEPTTGRAVINGKMASLLEVGTGFHPELTGRENIFFNGSILGMSQKEIRAKFDDIVEFSEVEKFLDTPVKFYSSGMYVRLAFAVAAHLDPDIMIIDEVLAVGDARFQKKSLAKMRDAAKEGRTVLFVSHSMESVKNLCQRVILLEDGKVKADGTPAEIIDKYLNNKNVKRQNVYEFAEDSSKAAQVTKIKIGSKDDIGYSLQMNAKWDINIDYTVTKTLPDTLVSVEILSDDNDVIYMTTDADRLPSIVSKKPGTYTTTVSFENGFLTPGSYYMRVGIQHPGHELFDFIEDIPLEVVNDPEDIRNTYFGGRYFGFISNTTEWETKQA